LVEYIYAAERRAQLARSRSRQNVLSPDAGGSCGVPFREINFNSESSHNSTPVSHTKRTPKKGSGNRNRKNVSSQSHQYCGDENDFTSVTNKNECDDIATLSEAEQLLERLRAL